MLTPEQIVMINEYNKGIINNITFLSWLQNKTNIFNIIVWKKMA